MHFPRAELAREIADALMGKSMLSDAPNGLFLAAPRRTGKSTFLQLDLAPELQHRGVVVVYVDLWADKSRDPAELIARAIERQLQENLGAIGKVAKKAGVKEATIAGTFKISTDGLTSVDGMPLVDAIRKLQETAGKPVALIIDEAQHALTSNAGEAAMTALKSARDQMNGAKINLMIVMSGSDRDKLLRLVNTNGSPFYGSRITPFKLLGEEFVDHVAKLVESSNSRLGKLRRSPLVDAFKAFGHRPQFFSNAISESLNPLTSEPGVKFEDAVLNRARARKKVDEDQMESDFLGIGHLEQAVIWRILEKREKFRPYDAAALGFYKEKIGTAVTPQQVQNALDSLRNRDPALIWKSQRGEYAVDDASMYEWFDSRKIANTWPPAGSFDSTTASTRRDKRRRK
jgi:hypothetical protein